MKRMAAIVLAAVILLLPMGCGSANTAASEPLVTPAPVTDASATLAPATETSRPTEALVTERLADELAELATATPEPTPEPTPTPDPDMTVRMSLAEINAMAAGLYVKRGDNFYIFSNFIPREMSKKYEIGFRGTSSDSGQLYHVEVTNRKNLTLGEVPLLTCGEGDQLVSRGGTQIKLHKVESVTWSLPIARSSYYDDLFYVFQNMDNGIELRDGKIAQFEITDASGNKYEDYHDLTYDKSYTISWFVGTNYNELTRKANWRYFTFDPNYTYELDGTLDRNGYASYDLSGVEPGTYLVSLNGLRYGYVEIT